MKIVFVLACLTVVLSYPYAQYYFPSAQQGGGAPINGFAGEANKGDYYYGMLTGQMTSAKNGGYSNPQFNFIPGSYQADQPKYNNNYLADAAQKWKVFRKGGKNFDLSLIKQEISQFKKHFYNSPSAEMNTPLPGVLDGERRKIMLYEELVNTYEKK